MDENLKIKLALISLMDQMGIRLDPITTMKLSFLKDIINKVETKDDECLVYDEINRILNVAMDAANKAIEFRFDNYLETVMCYCMIPYMQYISSALSVKNENNEDNIFVDKELMCKNLVETDIKNIKKILKIIIKVNSEIANTELTKKFLKLSVDRLPIPEVRILLTNMFRIIERERQIFINLFNNKELSMEELNKKVKELEDLEKLLLSCCKYLRERHTLGNKVIELTKKI